ncbi:hypothetical protein RUM43_009851 [Polyplax serrata]|uniref:Uncharacterized protein n=1 Tax=Polyplax serrata TaxID=468196 RepID=A0AAN8S7Q0_POLSC
MDNFFSRLSELVKLLDVKAQNKQVKPRKRWLLNKEYLEPVNDDDDVEEENATESSGLKSRAKCLYEAARYGVQEGVLAGVFFGGCWGICKFIMLPETTTPPTTKTDSQVASTGTKTPYSGSAKQLENNTKKYSTSGESEGPTSGRLTTKSSEAPNTESSTSSPKMSKSILKKMSNESDSERRGSHNSEIYGRRLTIEESDTSNSQRSATGSEGTQGSRGRFNMNDKFIGYAFTHTESFEDSDKQAEDQGESDGQSRKKPDSDTEGEKTPKQSRSTLGEQSTSQQKSSSKNLSRHISLKAPLEKKSSTTLTRKSSSKMSTNEQIKSGLSRILSRHKPTDVSVTPSKATLVPSLSQTSSKRSRIWKQKSRGELSSSQTFPQSSDNESDADNKNKVVMETLASDHSFASDASEVENFDANLPTMSDIHQAKSKSITLKKIGSETLGGNIWPGRNVSKSIMRNAESLSNGYLSENNLSDFIGMEEDNVNALNAGSSISEIGKSEHKRVTISTADVETWLHDSGNVSNQSENVLGGSSDASENVMKASSDATHTELSSATLLGTTTPNQSAVSNVEKSLSKDTSETSSNLFTAMSSTQQHSSAAETIGARSHSQTPLSSTTFHEETSTVPNLTLLKSVEISKTTVVSNQNVSSHSQMTFLASKISELSEPDSVVPAVTAVSAVSAISATSADVSADRDMLGSTLIAQQDLVSPSYQNSDVNGSALETTRQVSDASQITIEDRSAVVLSTTTANAVQQSSAVLAESRGTLQSIRNMSGLDKSTSSFIRKVGPGSDNNSRSSSVAKTPSGGGSSMAPTITSKDGSLPSQSASNFNLLSAINDNIIVLTACNCALVMGVICGVISTTRASLKI